ncbi:MAG: hypothetical protein LBR44_07205 [Clostridiales Family XIII bacterium]|jgi:hypothetical protein|nr:hypothetical protein [Clostridiales Family XIII bacterium]
MEQLQNQTVELQNQGVYALKNARGTAALGGNQWWLREIGLKPESGCGPTTAANIFWYFLHNNRHDAVSLLKLMGEIYPYAKPSPIGLMPGRFLRGTAAFAKDRGLPLRPEILRAWPKPFWRPTAQQAAAFLRGALEKGIPAAFLMLSKGADPTLDHWHWVTVTGVTGGADPELLIMDNGNRKRANLQGWLEKSLLGGAFVRFTPTMKQGV